jgi:hypothetical protein
MMASKKYRYGIPYRCPKCPEKEFFGLLKIPHEKLKPCPNCRSRLVQASELPPAHHLIDPAVEE